MKSTRAGMRKLLREDSKVAVRVKSWFDRKSFNPESMRELQLSLNITVTLAEVGAYKMIKLNMETGEVPYYVTDVLILAFALLEIIVSPYISWWGYQRRRKTLIAYSIVALACSVPWLFLPHARSVSVSLLCDAANQNNSQYVGLGPATIARLVILISTCIVFKLTRIACWSHGIAYSDEYAPARTSLHYAVAITTRVLSLVLADRVLIGSAANIALQAWPLLLGLLLNLVLAIFVLPKVEPVEDRDEKSEWYNEDRGFLTSIGRVMYNSAAMTQMFSMGLMAAALWGYLYNEEDILSSKFNMKFGERLVEVMAEFALYHFVFILIVFAGILFAEPLMKQYSNLSMIRQVITMSFFTMVTFIALTAVPGCDRGEISGLSRHDYTHPECSVPCDCKPDWREFHPVCAVEDMVTYLSPCQAGCQSSDIINGASLYTNCTCTTNGVAIPGACSDSNCNPLFVFHKAMIIVLVTFAVLVFHAQGMLLLRVVDKRDKSVVMGLAWSVVVIITFVCGHLMFIGINVATCSWFEDERCHIKSAAYPVIIGSICCTLAFLSLLVSFGSWMGLRVSKKIERLPDS